MVESDSEDLAGWSTDTDPDQQEESTVEVVLVVGQHSVGKSTLLQRFCGAELIDEEHDSHYVSVQTAEDELKKLCIIEMSHRAGTALEELPWKANTVLIVFDETTGTDQLHAMLDATDKLVFKSAPVGLIENNWRMSQDDSEGPLPWRAPRVAEEWTQRGRVVAPHLCTSEEQDGIGSVLQVLLCTVDALRQQPVQLQAAAHLVWEAHRKPQGGEGEGGLEVDLYFSAHDVLEKAVFVAVDAQSKLRTPIATVPLREATAEAQLAKVVEGFQGVVVLWSADADGMSIKGVDWTVGAAGQTKSFPLRWAERSLNQEHRLEELVHLGSDFAWEFEDTSL
eukprot:TRINITY_DN4532_c0_g1_i1.p1 TRINITY_DN4532_c0_g1~~TRINITY_DN4532_c0_g1_i1.p1  ORF type:complete len:337 (+),score=104.78 TRINITY_DN4532_c0_g1_i1:229-1239(+)